MNAAMNGDCGIGDQTLVVESVIQNGVDPVSGFVRLPRSSTAPQLQTGASQLKKKPKKRNYDPNKARKAQQLELVQLRKEATELRLKLQQLQTIRNQQSPLSLCTTATGPAVPTVWEEIACRQLKRRLKAEKENVVLKKQCLDGRKLATAVEQELQKRLKLRGMLCIGASKHTRRIGIPAGFVTHVAALIYQQLLDGVELSCQEIDNVFETPSPIDSTLLTNEPLLRDELNGMYLELFDSKIMPFDLHSTGDAWWKRWHNYKGQRVQENADNTIAEKYGLEMIDIRANTSATFYVQQILRRYVESSRIVIVWHAYIEPLEFEKERITGVDFLEKGYVIIQPYGKNSSMSSDGNTEVYSRVSTCYVTIPNFVDPKLRTDPKTAALTEFVVGAMSANISTSTEMIENLLMEQTLQRPMCV